MTQEPNEEEKKQSCSPEESIEQSTENITQEGESNTIIEPSEPVEPSEQQVSQETETSTTQITGTDEVVLLKEKLARLQADYDNFKKRVEREREELAFFINSKTFSRILPRVDDLERILANTPENLKGNTLYTGIEALNKALSRDIEGLGVKLFVSKGQKVNPEKHDVMTQVPGEEGIIIDEFEKGYMLGDKVLRPAKVVVGSGN